MESVVATIEQFATRSTKAGEVFVMTADGVEYSTFRREIWQDAYPYAQQRAKINFVSVIKGDRVFRNLESVEPANGQMPTQPALPQSDPEFWRRRMADVPDAAKDYARPKAPEDREDIFRSVALAQAVGSLSSLEPIKAPNEILGIAEYYLAWLKGDG